MRPEPPRDHDPQAGQKREARGVDARAELGGDRPADGVGTPEGSRQTARRAVPWVGLILVLFGSVGVTLLTQTFNPVRGLGAIDIPTIEWFADHRTGVVSDIMQVITMAFGKVLMPVIVIVLSAAWWAWTRRLREPIILMSAMALSTVISLWIKTSVGRPRSPAEFLAFPGLEKSMSFPSGHVIGAATLMLVGGYLVWRVKGTRRSLVLWLVLGMIVPAIVAVSRMYLGHHFPTDVLGGACIALIALGLVVIFDSLMPDGGSRSPRAAVDGVPRASRP